MGVVFLCTRPERGEVKVDGDETVTGLSYVIGPVATPVSEYDVDDLLSMTAPPCCGHSLPFGGMVKIFGKTAATALQMALVPDSVLNARPRGQKKPEPIVLKTKRARRHEEMPIVELEEPVEQPVMEPEESLAITEEWR